MMERIRAKPILMHMPRHVKRIIVESADTRTRLAFERTCTELLSISRTVPFHLALVHVRIHECGKMTLAVHDFQTTGPYCETMEVFRSLASHPESTINTLRVDYSKDAVANIMFRLELLSQLGSLQINVEHLQLMTDGQEAKLRDVLHVTRAGVLISIDVHEIDEDNDGTPAYLAEVSTMRQWRQARRLRIPDHLVFFDTDTFCHFEYLWIGVFLDVEPGLVQRLIDIYRADTTTVARSVRIYEMQHDLDHDAMEAHFQLAEGHEMLIRPGLFFKHEAYSIHFYDVQNRRHHKYVE